MNKEIKFIELVNGKSFMPSKILEMEKDFIRIIEDGKEYVILKSAVAFIQYEDVKWAKK